VKSWSLAAIFAVACFAQSPQASVAGSISDERDAPVIAARLSLKGEQTQLYLTKSTEQGTFQFARMEPGTYTLAIDQQGFCKLSVPAIRVAAGEQKALPRIILKVAPDGQDCP
jgi:hypothetical protein